MGNIRGRIWYSWHIGRSECDNKDCLSSVWVIHWEAKGDAEWRGSCREETAPGLIPGRRCILSVMQEKQPLNSEPVNGYSSMISVSTWDRGRRREQTLVRCYSLWFWDFFIQLFTIHFSHSCIFSRVNPWFPTWHHIKCFTEIQKIRYTSFPSSRKLVSLSNTAVKLA